MQFWSAPTTTSPSSSGGVSPDTRPSANYGARGVGPSAFARARSCSTARRTVGRHHRVGVVDGPVPAREGDPAPALPDSGLELGPDLALPLLEPVGPGVDHP